MKISEMKKILKEMKEICNFKDSETEINVRSRSADPMFYDERVSIRTTINGIHVALDKDINKSKRMSPVEEMKYGQFSNRN
ncbi:MAG: hypothetical protein IJX17_00285 [Clostridia bacterium]|nr:hypothetical protein [Clostridia bacterium]